MHFCQEEANAIRNVVLGAAAVAPILAIAWGHVKHKARCAGEACRWVLCRARRALGRGWAAVRAAARRAAEWVEIAPW